MGTDVDGSALTGDPRFFRRTGPHTLAAVVDAAEGEAPPRRVMLHRIAPLRVATAEDVTFCINGRKNLSALRETKAGAVIVHPAMRDSVPEGTVAIVAVDPLVAWARVAALFHPDTPVTPGVHASAVVAPGAKVHPTAEIGPLAVIGDEAVIGPRARIGAHAVIGLGVLVGTDVRIGPHVTVSHCVIGDRVRLYPGARIGQDGFGFAVTADGFHSVPQLGRVLIEDDVEIGANTTIDRGALEDTVIGAGSRIDNLVQIGHNCRIGRACVLTGQVGLAGSVVLEDYVVMGGQSGVADHIRVAKGTRIAAKSGVIADVTVRSDLVGAPAQPAKAFFRELAMIRRWARSGQPQGGRGDRAAGKTSPDNADVD
jgi:UDP-3-O-[3-hydroxymyristoyl] glucosamine N-acyltransferase